MLLTHPKALNQISDSNVLSGKVRGKEIDQISQYSVLRPGVWPMNAATVRDEKRTMNNWYKYIKFTKTLWDLTLWNRSTPAKTFLDGLFVVKIIWGYSILRSLEGICWHMALTNYKHPQIFVRKTYCQLWNVWLIIIWKMLL